MIALYERWRQIASEFRSENALQDIATGRHWTFSELNAASEIGGEKASAVAFPKGMSAEFVLEVLRAWRLDQVVCPLEAEQSAPDISGPLPSGIAHLKTTSASTGPPRLVAFTSVQLAADAENIVQTMGLRRDWPNIGCISLAHSYGFSNLVLPLLLHGIPLMLTGSSLPEGVRHATALGPAFTLAGVPMLWRTWQEARAIGSSIRLAISAGAPLPLSLETEVYKEHRLKIHNFYGSSECGGIAYDDSNEPRQDNTCVGAPMKNVTLRVNNDGCLEVSSRAVGETYWLEPGSNLGRGVFRTADLVEIINGRVFFRGRASDQINIAGRKVLPENIEKVLAAHPGVKECLAFGVPSADPTRGEMIVACLAADAGLTDESIKQFALSQLPAWQVPREWWFVDSLSANQRGKLSRAEWKKRYLARAA